MCPSPQCCARRGSCRTSSATTHPHTHSAHTNGEIVTATGDGRVGFVDAGDIAAVAAHALADEEPHLGEYVLTGPEALSYTDAAAVLSEVTGRPVRHRAVGVAELTERFVAAGYACDFARVLAGLDAGIARGVEDCTTCAVQEVTGRPPRSFREVVREIHLPAGAAT